jgi:hypothetical protein
MLTNPSLQPITTCPALLTAIALACWFGGKSDNDEAPPILNFLPATVLITPFLYTLEVFGLNANMLLSSAVV